MNGTINEMQNDNEPLASIDTTFESLLNGWSTVAQQLITMRGFSDPMTLQAFLNPSYEAHLHDPFLLSDMKKACELIIEVMHKEEKIAVFSDYDCDGIPGAVIMHDAFSALSYENVITYIPHRHYEGFGLNVTAVEKLFRDGVTLIITVDCGITDHEAIARASELGIRVIVTDHHEPPNELPTAAAIINPKLFDYPFPHLCGAAVAFKLATALLQSTPRSLPIGHEKWWLDMVGIATIADMVPLVGENRVFAYYGLRVLRKSKRPGLKALLRSAKANQHYLTEDDIGFTLGPRINAASRMDAPESAFHALIASSIEDGDRQVAVLESLNTARKAAVAKMTKELRAWVKQLNDLPEVIVFGNPAWRPSLVGLAAAKLAEEYNRPVFLWGRDGNAIHKGSCRSGGGVSVLTLMQGAKELFIEHGGHHFSGGYSLHESAVFTFSAVLNEVFHTMKDVVRVETVRTPDATITFTDVLGSLPRELEKLAPFGVGNPKPLFSLAEVVPDRVQSFGKAHEHTKLTFYVEGRTLEAVAFFMTPTSFTVLPRVGEPCTLLAHIERSYFKNRSELRLRIVDII